MNNLDDGMDFSVIGKTAVITGGSGVLCGAMSRALARKGARVAVLGRNVDKAQQIVDEIIKAGGQSIALGCDVTSLESLENAARVVEDRLGPAEILINGAGGNSPFATTDQNTNFFDLPSEALQQVVELNLLGTLFPCQIFGRQMAAMQEGVILNISSMAAGRPLTRVVAYSAAKAGVENFTRWLAAYIPQTCSTRIRVNAIAPGFFLGEQNRSLLVNSDDGSLTPRGRTIIDHTPLGRFGVPEDLLGAVLWLVSPASAFVTGIVVPVDGGFSAFSGV